MTLVQHAIRASAGCQVAANYPSRSPHLPAYAYMILYGLQCSGAGRPVVRHQLYLLHNHAFVSHLACMRAASIFSSCTRICSSIFLKISGGSCRLRASSKYCRRLLKNSLNFRDQYALKSALPCLSLSSLLGGGSPSAAATRKRCRLVCLLHLLGLRSCASCCCG